MEKINNELNSMVKKIAREVVAMCSEAYNFDEEEAMVKVSELLNINLEKKRKQVSMELPEEEEEKRQKSLFPLPFNGLRDDRSCQGLRHNHHQYTQCESKKMKGDVYCKTCKSQAVKNENGLPTYGTIESRLACGIFDFKDPNGLKPKPYSWVMKKLKLTEKAVEDEAERVGVRLLKEHFEVLPIVVVPKKKRTEEKKEIGRPKKIKTVVFVDSKSSNSVVGGGDLFKELAKVAEASQKTVSFGSSDEDSSSSSDDDDVEEPAAAKDFLKEDELAAAAELKRKEDELAAAAELKRKEDELAAAAELKRKEDEVAAELKRKEEAAEKKKRDERKKEKKEAALLKQKAEEEALIKKKAEEEEALIKKKAEEEEALIKKKAEEALKAEAAVKVEAVERVKRVHFEGKQYLRSLTTGIVYTTEKEQVGTWDDDGQKIVFDPLSDESSEEEEDEYDK